MFELKLHEITSILPLLVGIKQKVLPYAICEGFTPGRVLVDRREDPQTALIWTAMGYFCLAGEPTKARNLPNISRVLTETFIPALHATGEIGLILITSTEAWKEYLPSLLPGRKVIEIYRRTFTFDPSRFSARGNWRSHIPPGFCLQPVDAVLAKQAGALAGWASFDDFLTNGIGFALLEGDKLASICTSAFTSRESVEIEIHTSEDYRRRGFAMLTASALIEKCLSSGKQPNWECFWDNEPSTALAGKLGFSPLQDYPVYYWKEKCIATTAGTAEAAQDIK
jgi:GNAT superfamily N-acetyltransferase